jgi:long-chain acyl-CoA synthetase
MLKTRSRPIKRTDDEIVFESPEKSNPIHDDLVRAKCSTLDGTWTWAVSRYGSRHLLGTRDILAEEDEVQPNGKVFKKFHLGDYRWLSYEDADSTAEHLGRGLRSLGMQPKERICIFADTRAEWFLTAIACFKQAFPLVTIYTNLGEEAVVHGVLQTEVSLIITSHELLPKFRAILKSTPAVKNIIYFEVKS